MKIIRRLDEEDIRSIIMEYFDVRPSQVRTYHITECRGCGMDEHEEDVFYIEVEDNYNSINYNDNILN